MNNSPNNLRRATIFIVGDIPTDLELIARILNHQGYQVDTFSNGQALLTQLEAVLPDLILLDITLPNINGYEIYQQIKTNEAAKNIPIIFLNERNKGIDPEKALSLDALDGVDYVTKPFQAKELISRVEIHLRLKQTQEQLQRKNEELASENNKRRKTEEALKKSRTQFRALADNIPGVVYISKRDEVFSLLYINDAIEALTGYPADNFRESKLSLSDLFHPDDKSDIYKQIDLAYQEGNPFQFSFRNRHRSGEYRWIEASGVVDQEGYIQGFLLDRTDWKVAETTIQQVNEELEQYIEDLSALNYVAQTVATITDLQTALEVVARQLTLLFQAQGTIIALFKNNRDTSSITIDHHFMNDVSELQGQTIPLDDLPMAEEILNHHRSVIVTEAQTSDQVVGLQSFIKTHEIKTVLGVPLLTRAEVTGIVILMIHRKSDTLTSTNITLAETIAGQIAGAIENAHLLAKEQRQRRVAESLQEVATILNSSLDQKTVLTKILEQLQRVVRFDGAGIFLRDNNDLVLTDGLNLPEGTLQNRISIDSSDPAAEVYKEQKPTVIPNTNLHPNWSFWEGVTPIQSWMGVPLLIGQTPIGVLTTDNFKVNAYSTAEVQRLQIFANQAATAIQNARQIEFTETALHETQLLYRVGSILAKSSNMQQGIE
ncbi:MAG: GAF domain-containing protein, partial [Chloroflexota bacterium]